MEILVFDKYLEERLGPHLSLKEYRCKCRKRSCTRTLAYLKTVKSFNSLRSDYGAPIKINSAFRCQYHNDKIGGKQNSYHRIGAALDLRPAKTPYTGADLDDLQELAELHFDVVLRYDGFIHCHNTGGDNICI